jgi:hypothetical protein
MKYLVLCQGFVGDILFASSIAKKLHEQDTAAVVDYVIPLVQPYYLLRANPFIHQVFVSVPDMLEYDQVIRIPIVDQSRPATIQFQEVAGIRNPSLEFDVYTLPQWNSWAWTFILGLQDHSNKNIVVGYDILWHTRAYNTREEQNLRGVGGPHRDTNMIVKKMSEHFLMIPIGLPWGSSEAMSRDASLYAMTASLIKHCTWMVGAEGGLTNLAAGVHTRTIITSDFIHQLYGIHGLFKPCSNGPKMGPEVYYPNRGHHTLKPWITDEEVADQMMQIIKENS